MRAKLLQKQARRAARHGTIGAAADDAVVPRILSGIEGFDRVLGDAEEPGMCWPSTIAFSGDPGAGKCLTGDAMIMDADTGELVRLDQWSPDRAAWSIDDSSLKMTKQRGGRLIRSGHKPVVELVTRLGRRLKCTATHPLLTPGGWRSLADLRVGDQVATPRALPCDQRGEGISAVEASLLGYAIGDGYLADSLEITSGRADTIARLRQIAASLGMTISTTNKSGTAAQNHRFLPKKTGSVLLLKHGLLGARSADKRVPTAISSGGTTVQRAFLSALLSCDGSVYLRKSGSVGFSYSTISRRLALDTQHLLLRFGVTARLRTKTSVVAGEPYVSYELVTGSPAQIRLIIDTFEICEREERQRAVRVLAAASVPPTRFDTVLCPPEFWEVMRDHAQRGGFADLRRRSGVTIVDRRHDRPLTRATVTALAEVVDHPLLRALGHGDVYWDEIASVVPCGAADVYDLSMPTHHNFLANDVIVHNSTLLNQVVDRLSDRSLWITAEETPLRIYRRSQRLGLKAINEVPVVQTDCYEEVLDAIRATRRPLIVVDSISRLKMRAGADGAGTTKKQPSERDKQGILEAMYEGFCAISAERNKVILIIAHVNKEGDISGSRSNEHDVDTVLRVQLNKESVRVLRCSKNRNGDTNEFAWFRMSKTGMSQVDPDAEKARILEEARTLEDGAAEAKTGVRGNGQRAKDALF